MSSRNSSQDPVWKRPRKITIYTPWERLPRWRVKLTKKQKASVLSWKGLDVEEYYASRGEEVESLELREARSLYRRLDATHFPVITARYREKAQESDLDQLKYQAWCDMCEGLEEFTKYRDERGPAYYELYRTARGLVIRELRKRYAA